MANKSVDTAISHVFLLQFCEFMAYLFDERYITSEVHGARNAAESKTKSPIAGMSVPPIVWSEVAFPTHRS